MKKTFCYGVLLCIVTPLSWAMFCSTGANGWIEEGMSEQAVIDACGAPDTQTQQDASSDHLRATQYWNYQQQSVELAAPTPSAPMKTTKMNSSPNILVVEINDNLVTSIASNGSFVSSGNCPNGGLVNVGDSVDMVASRCGAATDVTSQYQKEASSQSSTVQWTYDLENNTDSLQVTFKDGVVSAISGQ